MSDIGRAAVGVEAPEGFQVDRTRGLLCPWCPPAHSGAIERKILIRECHHDPFKLTTRARKAEVAADHERSNAAWWKAQYEDRLAKFDALKANLGVVISQLQHLL